MRPQDPRGTPGRAAAMPVVAGAVTVDARDRMSMEVHQNVKGPSPRGLPRTGANGVTASAEPQGATRSHVADSGLFLRQRIIWEVSCTSLALLTGTAFAGQPVRISW